MRVIVDVDGVIADFVGSFLRCYQDYGGEVPEGWVSRHWTAINTDLPNPEIALRVWGHPSLFRDMEAYPGAIEALKEMNDRYDVRIATMLPQPWDVHIPARIAWLGENVPFLLHKQLYFCHDKNILDGDWMIEDNVDNLKAWLNANDARKGALVNRSWNENEWRHALPANRVIYIPGLEWFSLTS